MTASELYEILSKDDKKFSIKELKQVVYELKQDALKESRNLVSKWANAPKHSEDYVHRSGFYNGEVNAFQIALDLLEHLEN